MRLTFIEKILLTGALLTLLVLVLVVNQHYNNQTQFINTTPRVYSITVNDSNYAILSENKHQLNVDSYPNLVDDILCIINGGEQSSIKCLRDNDDEVYVPFNAFLKNYYEVAGSIVKKPEGEIFEFWHSKARIVRPNFTKYDPQGAFGSFGNYNVEHRERVQMICGKYGVPLSNQWNTDPYYYSVQIAQYALEHYSRNLSDIPRLEVSFGNQTNDWKFNGNIKNVFIKHSNNAELEFKTDSELSVKLPKIEVKKWPILRFFLKHDVIVEKSFVFKVTVKKSDTQVVYEILYTKSDTLIDVQQPNRIVYGIGTECCQNWKRFTRNLLTDFTKGLLLLRGKKRRSATFKNLASRLVLLSFHVQGKGHIRSLSQRSSSHDDHFFDAVEFLMQIQEKSGAFPVPVNRTLADGRLILHAGWVSAMAQGHFLSASCRAYHVTQNDTFKMAALAATKPFEILSSNGGVRSLFLDQIPWYEEYPTYPKGTFVLNGFIYSLIGLYDAWKLCGDEQKAKVLFSEGLSSLKKMLPLFDTGSGSYYDLRHASLNGHIAPNSARWDYHAVHIYQLLWLHLIDGDEMFSITADRWIGYMKGKRAKHN